MRLRALARKHHVAVEDLPTLQDDIAAKIAALDDGGAAIAERSRRREDEARQAYLAAADAVTIARAPRRPRSSTPR